MQDTGQTGIKGDNYVKKKYVIEAAKGAWLSEMSNE